LGDIDYFLEQRNLENLREAEKKTKEVSEEKKTTTGGKQTYEEQKKLKSLQNKLSKTEAKIAKLEKELKEIDVELQVNYDATIAQDGFFEMYQGKKDQLNQLMEDWESVTERVEKLQL
jgi:ATP-binding cassette subfamily F protein 3